MNETSRWDGLTLEVELEDHEDDLLDWAAIMDEELELEGRRLKLIQDGPSIQGMKQFWADLKRRRVLGQRKAELAVNHFEEFYEEAMRAEEQVRQRRRGIVSSRGHA